MQSVAHAGTADAEAAQGNPPQVDVGGAEVITMLLDGELDGELELVIGVEVVDGQGVVGLAVTHAHRALTESSTWRPVAMPQPATTQLSAEF